MTMLSYAGQLLVATPRLVEPTFARSVILMLDHDEDGALGVVINRPSTMPLEAVLPSWSAMVAGPAMLFSGGPVSPEAALAVAVAAADVDTESFKPLTGAFGLVDLDADPIDLGSDLIGVRVFSGYAGWSVGQLELEVMEGSWYVVPALTTDVFSPVPHELWRQVLRRQGGDLAYVATFPDDPTMN
jgi:putative transcriptional regulator